MRLFAVVTASLLACGMFCYHFSISSGSAIPVELAGGYTPNQLRQVKRSIVNAQVSSRFALSLLLHTYHNHFSISGCLI